ncbi:DNA photolyase family protein [Epibacterium ulvae]|uniref:cryptochrome/photolyase family protein n=1 Tax=Epibacterium ulvae TaxID=1156985 RepID=UPI001BFCB06F|nr:deoxyribodipyrimidine photo-lyase [Epibacterium ulvae]MBT8154626.1 DNA photolyase family protein [Epibacterium ulvae]
MKTKPIVIWWIRRDLRLADNPVLDAIAAQGGAVVPVYISDPIDAALGAAPQFRLGLGLAHLQNSLAARSLRLIVRRGAALQVLRDVVQDCGASAVYWSRLYDPQAIARDIEIKTSLKNQGVEARSFGGRLLFEPWSVEKKTGGFFQVYTPFWRAVATRPVSPPTREPARLQGPQTWPTSDTVESLGYAKRMQRAAGVVAAQCRVGEQAAFARAEEFVHNDLPHYAELRDVPSSDVTSGLSENLAWGEIAPRQIWAACDAAAPNTAVEKFRKELVWREFSYHLMYHTPHILDRNWRSGWEGFAWSETQTEALSAWQQGRTGIDLIDAGMRELYVTGKMHNRVRMVAASFLCKHLMVHWKMGMQWFQDCLVDWDPAANAMGWQWVAGCGPDAAPFFRIFNPDGQRQKFDPDGAYCRKWIAEGQRDPPDTARAFFAACPKSWTITAETPRPPPIVELAKGRARALAAYETLRKTG